MAVIFFVSCTVVRDAPVNTPFVYKNSINIEGSISKDEKKRLELELENYWDDSLAVKMVTKFGVRNIIKEPNIFDSAAINSSITFMRGYLNSQGYYNTILRDSIRYDTAGSQIRTTIAMNITIGKGLTIDSVSYRFANPLLDSLAKATTHETQLRKNRSYSKQAVAGELDRLIALFRKNGYFGFTRDELVAIVDTTDVALLEITLDPFEQARRIAEAADRRRLNPTVDIEITERDSTKNYRQYYVDEIVYYPQTRINDIPDSMMEMSFKLEFTDDHRTSKQNSPFVHFKPLAEHTYMRRGNLYNEERYIKTVNALSLMGTWSQVDMRTRITADTLHVYSLNSIGDSVLSVDSIRKIDFHFFLTPARKYAISTDLEVSRNSGTILNGNLLGIANNITFRNRNLWREAIQSGTTARNGIEISPGAAKPLQTFQSSISHTLSIPKFITPWRVNNVKRLDGYKTLLNVSAAYTERRDFFRLRSLVGSWGYEWKRKSNVWLYRPLNVELYTLDTLAGLVTAFNKNPFLRTAFNTGYVVSQTLSFNTTFPGSSAGVSNYLRLAGEEAGGILGLLKGLHNKLYRYIKTEGEFRQLRTFRKTSLAWRFFGGIGYNYNSDTRIGQTLPFFKQFVAGGPNSMRAWPLRQLGLGSSNVSDTSTTFRDRFGDVQLETNIEYRFPLTTVSGVKIGSAIFADVGNIWNLKSSSSNDSTTLEWKRFGRDIAIGVGTGIRFDFSYFLVRIDFAYKVKDPARRENNGWMSISDFEWRNKELAIRDDDGNLLKRNNYAFQLGIGLPF